MFGSQHLFAGVYFWALFEDVKVVLMIRHGENPRFLIFVEPFEGLMGGECIGEYFNLKHKRHLV